MHLEGQRQLIFYIYNPSPTLQVQILQPVV